MPSCSYAHTTVLEALSVSFGFCRYHASSLVCSLVRCACDPGHQSPVTPTILAALAASKLLVLVAHLAFQTPNCSCLHTALLEALSVHTLPSMPEALWAPLLREMSCTGADADVNSVAGILLHHGEGRPILCMQGSQKSASSVKQIQEVLWTLDVHPCYVD
jgi:hypothetical protein